MDYCTLILECEKQRFLTRAGDDYEEQLATIAFFAILSAVMGKTKSLHFKYLMPEAASDAIYAGLAGGFGLHNCIRELVLMDIVGILGTHSVSLFAEGLASSTGLEFLTLDPGSNRTMNERIFAPVAAGLQANKNVGHLGSCKSPYDGESCPRFT